MRTTIEEQAEVLGHDMNTERVEPETVDTPEAVAIQHDGEKLEVTAVENPTRCTITSDVWVEVEQ